MTELIQPHADAALAWLRRHLLGILSIAAALGFAQSELANLREALGEARRDLAALHREFIEFRLGGGAVSKSALSEALARQRDVDWRQDEDLKLHQAQILALLQSAAARSPGAGGPPARGWPDERSEPRR